MFYREQLAQYRTRINNSNGKVKRLFNLKIVNELLEEKYY